MRFSTLLFILLFIQNHLIAQEPFGVSIDSFFYTSVLDQSQKLENTILTISPTLKVGQTFKGSRTGKFVGFNIMVRSISSSTDAQLTAKLNNGNAPGGALLSTVNFAVSGNIFQSYLIPFPDSVNVAANDYFISLEYNSGASVQIKKMDTNPYPNGNTYFNSGSWTALANDDLWFSSIIAVDDSASVSTMALTQGGRLRIKNYLLPQVDGQNGEIIKTDGNGNLQWTNLQMLTDKDLDTYIDTEESNDDDALQFYSMGTKRLRLIGHQIQPLNNGGSVFLGDKAGKNDNLNDNHNIMIGDSTGINSINGSSNVFVGYAAGRDANINKSVFIGNRAGTFETNNERLYIENSIGDKNEALIYGEFDNDVLRVNASMEVLTQKTIDGITVKGDPTSNKVHLRLENNNTAGHNYEISSTGGGAPVGQSKFVIRNVTNGTNDLVLDEDGDFGFGVDNPVEKLDINGNIQISGMTGTGSDQVFVNTDGKLIRANNGIIHEEIIEWPDFIGEGSETVFRHALDGAYVADFSGAMIASLDIPNLAIITSVTVRYLDDNNSGNIDFSIQYSDGISSVNAYALGSSSTNGNVRHNKIFSNQNIQINRLNNNYAFRAFSTSWGASLKLFDVVISYIIP